MKNQTDNRAIELLNSLHPAFRRDPKLIQRPFIVEFDGMPSSGKTTIIKELDKYFRHNAWRVLMPQEGAQSMRHIPRTSLAEYNIRTALYNIQMIMDTAWTHTYDLVLLDRGIFDCGAWVGYLQNHDLITPNEAIILNRFYHLPFFTQKIDCALIVICEPQIALQREQATQVSSTEGFTNLCSLTDLYEQSRTLYQHYHPMYPQLKLFDTTFLTPRGMVQEATDVVLSTLSLNVQDGVYPASPVHSPLKTA